MKVMHITTAALSENRYYKDFSICEGLRGIYGYYGSIVTCYMVLHDDQTRPDKYPGYVQYWGWYSYTTGKISMIYPSFIQLCCCLSIKHAEEKNEGRAVRLDILNNIFTIELRLPCSN